MNIRRRAISITLALIATATTARADPTPEELKAMYEDSQRQLQQSQDRKNQLANENEQLRTRVAELEGQLRTILTQASHAEFMRNQYAVWVAFMKQYPALLKRFETYLGGDASGQASSLPTVQPRTDFFDPHWPFSAASGISDVQ